MENCDNCFYGLDQCYECNSNNDFYLNRDEGGKTIVCKSKTNYVLKLPLTDNDVTFKLNPFKDSTTIPPKYEGYTVNFFIKIYGFTTTEKVDIIYLSENLKISYNSNFDDKYFGLNLVTFTGSSETVVSNYYDFRKHFGLWTFISVATYNKTNDTFFPPMVRFEINQKKMPIVGPLDYLNIQEISFSEQIFALVQKLKIYSTYLLASHAFETNIGPNNDIEENFENFLLKEYFIPKNNCKFESGIDVTKKSDGSIINDYVYPCESDNDEELLRTDIPKNQYIHFTNESRFYENGGKCDDECDICIEGTKYDCSCNYKNNQEKLFLGNVSNHYCNRFKYINFAKGNAEKKNLTNYTSKFTLHFWVFAYSYVENVFQGLEVEWKNHVTNRVYLDSTKKYYFDCIINGESGGRLIDFNMNKWNFLHCALDYDSNKAYIATEEESFEIFNKTYYRKPPDGTNDFNIRDLTTVKDWGVLFYKHIRLWNDTFQYSSFLSRINITKTSKYFSSSLLLFQYNTTFIKEHIHKALETRNENDEIPTNYLQVEYDEEKIGTNIVPEEIYQDVLDEPKACDK